MPRVWPKKIYLKNETMLPQNTDICDAETDKPLYGIMNIAIHLTRTAMDIKVTGATTEPFTNAIKHPPDSSNGEYDYDGVVVEDHHYYVRRIDVEGEE